MKIKEERLAKRCEICHQADMFDAEENQCLRCEKIIRPLRKDQGFIDNYTSKSLLDKNKLKAGFAGTISCGLLSSICLLPNINIPYAPLILIPLSGFVATWFYIYKSRIFLYALEATSIGLNTGIQFIFFLLIITVITAPFFEHFDSYILGYLFFLSPIIIVSTAIGSLFAGLLCSLLFSNRFK